MDPLVRSLLSHLRRPLTLSLSLLPPLFRPDASVFPTGDDLCTCYFDHLWAWLSSRATCETVCALKSRVVSVARGSLLKGDMKGRNDAGNPFRLLVAEAAAAASGGGGQGGQGTGLSNETTEYEVCAFSLCVFSLWHTSFKSLFASSLDATSDHLYFRISYKNILEKK